jgi:predicted ATPase/DNA-binding winged helix-turn-helix (wHTH) protein
MMGTRAAEQRWGYCREGAMLYLFDDYTLDTQLYELRHAGVPHPLEPQVFAILCYLIEHRDHVVSRRELLEHVWPERFISETTLDHRVMQVRQSIGDSGQTQRRIHTLRSRGYRFVGAVEERPTGGVSLPPVMSMVPPSVGTPAMVVGRDAELAQLHQWYAAACQGLRQVVCITGEVGIGKTTLVDAFVTQVAARTEVWVGLGQCIEHHGPGEAYLPLLEVLGRLGRSAAGGELVALLRQYAPSWLPHLPTLVPVTELTTLERQVRGATQERMLRELAQAVEVLTTVRPLVLVLEDLHWSDSATLDWLVYMARRRETARLLVLATYRPVEAAVHAHPIRRIAPELQVHGQCAELALDYFSEAAVATYLAQRFPRAVLPEGLARVLHRRTNGNPLFMVTMVDALVRQGVLRAGGTEGDLVGELTTVAASIPQDLRQLLERHVEQLAVEEQTLLEAASAAGAEFAVAAVAAAVEWPVVDVEEQCAALARRGQFVQECGTDAWPDGTVASRYGFLHALYRETLYARVPLGRRVRWHQRIGHRLEAGYGPQVRERAAELAEHFVRGHDPVRAVRYLHYAGQQSGQRSAHQEALQHLTRGLELLATLPDTPARVRQELDLLITLGPVLSATKGYGALEVEHTYTRAREICQQMGDTLQLSQVLWGLLTCCVVRAEHQTARQLGEQLLTLAQRQQDATLLCLGHFAVGAALYNLGEFAPAREHLEQSIALDDPQQYRAHPFLFGMDLGIFCRSWAAHALWLLGYSDQALTMSHTALARARELSHPFSLALALNYAAILHQFRREGRATHERTKAATVLCREQGFAYYLTWGPILQGWVLAEQGQDEEGMALMRQGMVSLQATGAQLRVPYYLALQAETCGKTGQIAEGLRLLAEALAQAHKTGEHWWEAEVYRLQGELRLRSHVRSLEPEVSTPDLEAEACFQQALGIARQQHAKSLELRAAMSLARLWQQQGKRHEAQQLLAPVYGWFTEGFDAADLQEAKGLLEGLA